MALPESLASALAILRRGALADALFFDEAAYRRENEDVAAAVDAGTVRSFYDHYVRFGRWEGRRFPLRQLGLHDRAAARLLRAAARIEARLDAMACRLMIGELGHRLRSDGGEALVKPLGPTKPHLGHGPWRAPLPRWARRPGWYTVHAKVIPVRAPLAFRPLGAGGEPLGEAAALFCQPTRFTQRLMRLPAGAEQLEVALLDQRLRTQPLRVRLRPVSDARVEARMVRRLVHHHRRYLGRNESEVRASLRRDAERSQRPLRELMWEAYHSTFPPPVAHASYADWIEKVEAPHLAKLDREAPERIRALSGGPLISVLVPTFNPAESHLSACLASVIEQSYPRWELCIADDASTLPHVRRILDEHAARDSRIRVVYRHENGHICRASNDALALARGELVALLDHDDVLGRHALLQVAEAAVANPDAELFYSDEDKLGEGDVRESPHFKPELDPDLLLGQNYIGHLLVARTERVRAAGGFRPGYEGSQDHDLVLRLTERLERRQVVHIPQVLYHWRITATSTALSSQTKAYAANAGMQAVRDALERRRTTARLERAPIPSCYRVARALPDPPPRISVIVPTRDAFPLVSRCVDGLLHETDYPALEVIVVDNGTRERRALTYLERIRRDRRVRVLRDERPFNFSALNNWAAREAAGEILVLLNNDIEILDRAWLGQLVAEAARPEIGCVGAKLLFPDGTVQHAGVLLGLHGLAGHPYRHASNQYPGYFGRLYVTHTVSAVTAACLAVKRHIYHEVGGFDEELAVAFNDVDFCIKVREAGYRNLLVPTTVLLHHESATRGLDHEGEKRARAQREAERVKRRWESLLYSDPWYSPHLSLDHEDYSLRIDR